VLNIILDVNDETIDIAEAVRKACTKYVATTAEGRTTYDYNCNSFNWADFAQSVPNTICREFGFEKIYDDISQLDVNWDEQLVNDDELPLSEDKWNQLKDAVRDDTDAISVFLGFRYVESRDADILDTLLNDALAKMPVRKQQEFYNEYC
jgi:hypothetical protein